MYSSKKDSCNRYKIVIPSKKLLSLPNSFRANIRNTSRTIITERSPGYLDIIYWLLPRCIGLWKWRTSFYPCWKLFRFLCTFKRSTRKCKQNRIRLRNVILILERMIICFVEPWTERVLLIFSLK